MAAALSKTLQDERERSLPAAAWLARTDIPAAARMVAFGNGDTRTHVALVGTPDALRHLTKLLIAGQQALATAEPERKAA